MKRNRPERRKRKRAPFRQDVQMEGAGTARCSMISSGGMYIETPSPLPEGSTVSLEFKLSGRDETSVKAHALVMYIHDGVGMGVAFSDLSPDDRRRIERLVHRK